LSAQTGTPAAGDAEQLQDAAIIAPVAAYRFSLKAAGAPSHPRVKTCSHSARTEPSIHNDENAARVQLFFAM